MSNPLKRALDDIAALHGSEAGPQEAREEQKALWRRFAAAYWYAVQNGHNHVLVGIETAKGVEEILRAGSEAGVSARVLELAYEAAKDQHIEGVRGNKYCEGHSDDGTALELGFSTCPHPDCALVRAALGVSPAAPEKELK